MPLTKLQIAPGIDKQNTELKEELKTLKENYHYLLEEINKIKQKIN